MKVSDIGEFSLIDIIKKMNKSEDGNIVAGIGDDAAVIRPQKNRFMLWTTDTLVEGVHFSFKYFKFRELGWKLLAVNLSDIAAMGGRPRFALVTLGVNKRASVSDIRSFYQGIGSLARKYQVSVIGGDIVRAPSKMFFTMGVIGYSNKTGTRSGARPGDAIISIGTMGRSAAGLSALKKFGRKALRKKGMGPAIRAHLMPVPMLKEGEAASKYATSMIDNSDGLARCLLEICGASKVGARVYLSRLPVATQASFKQVFDGGEDYNLILTAPKKISKLVRGGRIIGEIIKGRGVSLVDGRGRVSMLKDKGFEHF